MLRQRGCLITEILLYWSRGGGPLIATVLTLGELLGEAKASQTFILRVHGPYSLILHSPSFWPLQATPFYTSIYPTGWGCLCETTPLQLSGQIMGLCIWDAETWVQLLL